MLVMFVCLHSWSITLQEKCSYNEVCSMADIFQYSPVPTRFREEGRGRRTTSGRTYKRWVRYMGERREGDKEKKRKKKA
jgi:hypothetical protein